MNARREIEVSDATRARLADLAAQEISPEQVIQGIRDRAHRDLVSRTEFFKSAIQKITDDANDAMRKLQDGMTPGHFGGRVLHSSGVEVELESGKWNQAVTIASYVLTPGELKAAIKEGLAR